MSKSGQKDKISFFKIILRVIPIQFKVTPWHSTVVICIGVVNGLTVTASVIATQRLFDVITRAAAGQAEFANCVIPLIVLAAVIFGNQIINGVYNFYTEMVFGKSQGKINTLLHRKLKHIDPAKFEDTAFLDDLNKAREGAKVVPSFSMTLFIMVSFYLCYFSTLGVYLFRLKPMLLITLAISFIPALLSQIVRGKEFTNLEQQSAPLRREYEYYQKTLCDREYFKETRILGAFHFFHQLFDETMFLLSRKQWQAERKTVLLKLSLNITTFGGMATASIMLFFATMSGEVTVGAFAAVFASLGQIFNIMQEIVTQHVGSMNQNIGKVANFIRMLDATERVGTDGSLNFAKGVTALNVTFTYSGRDEPAVKNVSLEIADGETIAIVGENGAGKSTLVRLLMGIYRPSEGKVTVGGLDTAVTTPASIYKDISGVFQKYQRYKMSLGENVAISNTESTTDIVKIDTALNEADIELNDDINLDTMLSPEFDGIDLSGGQWQRIAIARGLYRANGFIVLDEPTSAIDPIEETKIYTKFQQLAEGKCAVVVTHRLGSAKLAHRIIVMESGEIADVGTHEELLARPGKYSDMWTAQAQWYKRADTTFGIDYSKEKKSCNHQMGF